VAVGPGGRSFVAASPSFTHSSSHCSLFRLFAGVRVRFARRPARTRSGTVAGRMKPPAFGLAANLTNVTRPLGARHSTGTAHRHQRVAGGRSCLETELTRGTPSSWLLRLTRRSSTRPAGADLCRGSRGGATRGRSVARPRSRGSYARGRHRAGTEDRTAEAVLAPADWARRCAARYTARICRSGPSAQGRSRRLGVPSSSRLLRRPFSSPVAVCSSVGLLSKAGRRVGAQPGRRSPYLVRIGRMRCMPG
jgi:hypothetical protein